MVLAYYGSTVIPKKYVERPEKQGGSVYIKGIFSMGKDTKMFLQPPRFCLSSGLLSLSLLPQCNDAEEMIDDQITQQSQVERKYLLDVIKCLRYLARQEIPLQGLDNNDNLTHILYLLGTKDDNITKHLQGEVGHKYVRHDSQNELLHIMVSVLRVKVSTICERKFFSIMADEGMDVSKIEQLPFCVRSVDDNLDVSEDLIGF